MQRNGLAPAATENSSLVWGLDEQGREEYYRQWILLKTRAMGEDMARAVIFVVTRQTSTAGAMISATTPRQISCGYKSS